jgi:hypothetical protein
MALNIQYSITRWADSKTTKRGVFEANPDRVKTQKQNIDSGVTPGTGSSILEQIRALRESELKKQSELDNLIDELEELE